jgi:hypothetical protein
MFFVVRDFFFVAFLCFCPLELMKLSISLNRHSPQTTTPITPVFVALHNRHLAVSLATFAGLAYIFTTYNGIYKNLCQS